MVRPVLPDGDGRKISRQGGAERLWKQALTTGGGIDGNIAAKLIHLWI